MTDRIRHLTVTLERDIREDDAESIISAIRSLRHVADVTPKVVTGADASARIAVRAELRSKLHAAVADVLDAEIG